MPNTKVSESLALVGQQNGVVIIPAGTPLTRLNYFDGKFLRASDLKAEQDYLRQLVNQSNQAGGSGVAYGYDLTIGGGNTLDIGPGLAIDLQGRVLLLPKETSINIQELIDKSRALQSFLSTSQVQRDGSFEQCQLSRETPVVNPLVASDLFVITISQTEALCGEEDVFGKLCEEACVTSTDRPFVVEGVTVRVIPLALQTPLSNSKAFPLTGLHLRSRVASAYFEDERRRVAGLISKAGLEQAVWCLGADAESGGGVPIGVIAREGSGTIFLDPWIARRERIDAPAKRYWQWRMMMRPWDVFLAQVLQFQCQLHDLFKNIPLPGGDTDPCGGARSAISEAAATIAELKQFYESATERFTTLRVNLDEAVTFKGGVSRLSTLNTKLLGIESALAVAPQDRLLIRGGIVELPSAGYLPVTPSAGLTINQQVRQMMGEGVDLRFCITSSDYVAHALEEAQHMGRISLLQGLDNPQNKPQVEILVPNGEIVTRQSLSPGRGFGAIVDLNPALFSSFSTSQAPADIPPAPGTNLRVSLLSPSLRFNGAARSEKAPSGGGAAYISAEYVISRANTNMIGTIGTAPQPDGTINTGAAKVAGSFDQANLAGDNNQRAGLWVSLECERNVFELKRGDTTNLNARAVVGATTDKAPLLDVELNGVFQITQETVKSGSKQSLKGRIENARLSFLGVAFDKTGDNTGPGRTILIDLDATVTLTGGSAIEIVLTHQQNQFELSANWDKQPLEFKADITTSNKAEGPSRETILAEAALKEDPNVLSDKNDSHSSALDALEVVAATLDDVNFADAKARLLFPSPPKPTDEVIVRGTRDWVLFHRRRDERCQEERPSPAPPPPSRIYQVYHLLAQSRDEAVRLRGLLLESKPLQLDRVSSVGAIEFGGGVAALVTSPESILKDWQKVKPGETIVYSAVGNRDSAAADGKALALSRLDRLEATLSPISKLDPRAIADLLSGLAPSIPAAGADGVMILFTVNEGADLQITMTATPDSVKAGQNITYTLTVTNAGPSPAANVKVTDGGEVLGPAHTTFVSATVPPGVGWDVTTPATGDVGNVVFTKDSVAAGESATFQIVVKFDSEKPDVTQIKKTVTVSSSTDDPKPVNNKATASTVAILSVRTAVVIFASIDGPDGPKHFPSADSPRATVVFKNNAPEGDALSKMIAGVASNQFPIKVITLAVLTPPPDAGALVRIEAVIAALAAAGHLTADPRKTTVPLSQPDRDSLNKIGGVLDGVDEVIFLDR